MFIQSRRKTEAALKVVAQNPKPTKTKKKSHKYSLPSSVAKIFSNAREGLREEVATWGCEYLSGNDQGRLGVVAFPFHVAESWISRRIYASFHSRILTFSLIFTSRQQARD